MGTAWVGLVVGGVAVCATGVAAAQEPEQTVEADELDPFHGAVALSAGISGTLGSDQDLRPTFGIELEFDYRLGGRVSVGAHVGMGYRQWDVVGDYYGDLSGRELDGKTLAGYAFGWGYGLGLFSGGPHVVLGSGAHRKPWASVGTSVLVSANFRDPDTEKVFAHGLAAGFGWHLGPLGLGVRAVYAPETGFLLGSTSAPFLSVLATVEWVVHQEPKQPAPSGP